MKLKILAFIAIVAMSVSGPVPGGETVSAYFDGARMLSSCESESITNQNLCIYYLAGIADAHETLRNWNNLPAKHFCPPKDVGGDQLRKIFIKYANDNLQYLHQDAGGFALGAFAIAFPCK